MAKVLIVEDDTSLSEIYQVRLQAEGFDVLTAMDGEEGLAVAIREKPDLIVSDVMMPRVSGFDMLDILKSTPNTQGIKIIMMTALSSEDQKERGAGLGADAYLVKSQVGIEDVVETVKKVLAGDKIIPSADIISMISENSNAKMNPAPTVPAAPTPGVPAQVINTPAPTAAPAPVAEPAAPAPMPAAPVAAPEIATTAPAPAPVATPEPIVEPSTNKEVPVMEEPTTPPTPINPAPVTAEPVAPVAEPAAPIEEPVAPAAPVVEEPVAPGATPSVISDALADLDAPAAPVIGSSPVPAPAVAPEPEVAAPVAPVAPIVEEVPVPNIPEIPAAPAVEEPAAPMMAAPEAEAEPAAPSIPAAPREIE